MAIVLFLLGALFVIIGFMMLIAPDALYQVIQDVIKQIHALLAYLNTQFYQLLTHLNKLLLKGEGFFFYRLVLAVSYILFGFLSLYSAYYCAQHAALPPPISGFFMDIWHRFIYAVNALDQAPGVITN